MSNHAERNSSDDSSPFRKPLIPKHEETVIGDDTRDAQQSKFKFFTIHEDASEITYIPEDALKEGLGMVKTIKQTLTKLELSSKLRAEVWDRELTKFVR